jgi:hypothetical protein
MSNLGAANDYVWSEDLQFNNGSQTTLPVLVVGTKADLVSEDRNPSTISEETGLDELSIVRQMQYENFAKTRIF